MVGTSSPLRFALSLFALSTLGAMTPVTSLARSGEGLDWKTQESDRRVDTPNGAPFDPRTDVERVHVMFCHHLDVGLDIGLKLTEDCVGFATKIVQRYFDVFIPRAIKLAQEVRATGSKNRFAYTMHPWILSLYVDCDPWKIEDDCPLNPGTLRCPSQAEVAAFDEAVLRGDILWAASPMNLDPGIVGSPTLFKELLSISEGLDARYNLTKTAQVWSNVDVPGFVRSAIPLLAQSGVKFLSIGANARGAFPNGSYPINEGSSPWQTVGNNFSSMFRWRDKASAEEIVVMYHRSYGSNFKLSGGGGLFPNTSLISETSGTALASYFRSDNTGPPASIAEINSIFKTVQEQFPAAKEVFGSTMDAFAAEVSDEDIASMPLLQHEWGDQWIGGLQTDPWRIQVYREMVRLREECITSGECKPESKGLRNMTRWLAKISEHTQGVQNEGWSPGVPGCMAADGSFQSPCTVETNKHWSNTEFEKIHNAENNLFTGADLSWIEARKFNDLAIGALEAQVGSDSGARRLVGTIKQQLPQLRPAVPNLAGLNQASLSSLDKIELRCGGMEMGFDNRSGAITHLRFGSLGAPSWATADHQMMDLRYMTCVGCTCLTCLVPHAYRNHGASHLATAHRYNDRANLTCNESGCPNPVAGSWQPNLVTLHHNCSTSKSTDFALRDCQSCHVIVEARWNDTLAGGKYGSASKIVTEYVLMPSNPHATATYPGAGGRGQGLGVVSVLLKLFNKTTTRLPESTVLLFQPRQPHPYYGWAMDVLGGWVDPYDVLAGGQQWAHAIWNGVKYTTDQGTTSSGLYIDSLDAAMACPMIAQWNFSSHSSGCTDPAGCSLIGDGSESVCDSNGLNGAGGQQQLNRTAGCPTTHSCRSFGVGGMAFQLHSNRMGISGFAQWYPFGIKSKGTYQEEDENILYRFFMSER